MDDPAISFARHLLDRGRSVLKQPYIWEIVVVSRSDVELCYRFILGREPESVAVVDALSREYETRDSLRRAMLNSEEFKLKFDDSFPILKKGLLFPPMTVDVQVAPEDLNKMLSHVERTWEELGASEPFWSVLTADDYLTSNFDDNKARFYDSGREDVNYFAAAAARAGITDFAKMPACLEYGSGVGRLTIWLAQRFRAVIGCDISQPHLDLARDTLTRRGIGNVKLVRVPTVDSIDSLPPFDVFFSLIVLQHNPPPVAAYILEKVLNKLNPGGLAYFQIPTYMLNYNFDAKAYLAENANRSMEMHVIPQHYLFDLFARCGCSVLEVREDDRTGIKAAVSNSFLLRK